MPPLNEPENADRQDRNLKRPSNGSYQPNDIRLWMNWTTRDQLMANINQFTAVLSGKLVSDDCKRKMFRRNNNAITTLISLQSSNQATAQIERTKEASPKKRMKLGHEPAKSGEQTPVFEISFNLRTKLIDHLNANLKVTILRDELDLLSEDAKSDLIKQNNNMNHQLLTLPVRVIEVSREDQPATNGRPNESVVFGFIGYSSSERQTFTEELAKIGIQVDHNGLESDYMITREDTLTKNELLFVSIARGKWICHPDFYRRTLELGALPDPEHYEWGSNEQYLNRLGPRYLHLARACRYWRLKVAETGLFAFHNQSHVIVSTSSKNYASILSNGGGLTVAAVELASKSSESYAGALSELYEKLKDGTLFAQYVLVNLRKSDGPSLCNLTTIQRIEQELKVKCLSMDYLSLFLINHDDLNVNKLLINSEN